MRPAAYLSLPTTSQAAPTAYPSPPLESRDRASPFVKDSHVEDSSRATNRASRSSWSRGTFAGRSFLLVEFSPVLGEISLEGMSRARPASCFDRGSFQLDSEAALNERTKPPKNSRPVVILDIRPRDFSLRGATRKEIPSANQP